MATQFFENIRSWSCVWKTQPLLLPPRNSTKRKLRLSITEPLSTAFEICRWCTETDWTSTWMLSSPTRRTFRQLQLNFDSILTFSQKRLSNVGVWSRVWRKDDTSPCLLMAALQYNVRVGFKNTLAPLLHDGNTAHVEPAISFAPSNFRKLQRFFSSGANIQEGTTHVQGQWRQFLSHVWSYKNHSCNDLLQHFEEKNRPPRKGKL